MSLSEFSRVERTSLLSSNFIISSLDFTWCIGKLMKLLPFCFWMCTNANMSVKVVYDSLSCIFDHYQFIWAHLCWLPMNQRWMNGSPLLMEDITIPYVNVLWLYLETNSHVFEGRVLQLLTKSPRIRVLNLSFQARDEVIIPFVIHYYSTFSASSQYIVE